MMERIAWASLWVAAASAGLVGCADTQLWSGGVFDTRPAQSNSAATLGNEDRQDYRHPANDFEKSRLSLARLTERRGQPKVAQQIYEKVLVDNPRSIVANHRLGVLAARQSKFELAEQYFQSARQLAPPTAELLADIGYGYYLQNRIPEAEQVLNEALKLEPDSVVVSNNLALVLGEQRRFDESLAAFQRVGTDAQAHANLAYIYSQLGEYDQAQSHYSRALSFDPTLRIAADAMVQIAERQRGRAFDEPPTLTVPQDFDTVAEPADTLVQQATPSTKPTPVVPKQTSDGMISVYDAAGSILPGPQTNRVATVKEAPQRNQAANHASMAHLTGTFRPLVSPGQQLPSVQQPTSAYLPPSVYQPTSASAAPKTVSYAEPYAGG